MEPLPEPQTLTLEGTAKLKLSGSLTSQTRKPKPNVGAETTTSHLSVMRATQRQCYASSRDKYNLQIKMQFLTFVLSAWRTGTRSEIVYKRPGIEHAHTGPM